jgi:hypothetical protein
MGGSADYNLDGPLAQPTPVAVVYRYDPVPGESGESYTRLDNVECLSVEFFEGARPPEARFRYVFGGAFADEGDPAHFEDVLPVDAKGAKVVRNDDRLTVWVEYPDADAPALLLWDGFAQVPQANASGRADLVTFLGAGTPVREWDEPLAGAICRDCNDPSTGPDTATGVRVRFNPDGRPNCTPDGFDHGSDGREDDDAPGGAFPVFFDERVVRDPDHRTPWTLSKAARYVIFGRQMLGGDIEEYVQFYLPGEYDAVLDARVPFPDPDGEIDPEDPDTYLDNPIEVQDLDVSGDPWPVALEKLISPHGFGFRFYLSVDGDGNPAWWVQLYRKDDDSPSTTLQMQPPWEPGDPQPLDVSLTNVASLVVQRDTSPTVNAWAVDSALTRYEVSVVLAPLFSIAAGDADPGSRNKWKDGDPAFDPVKYRVFGADEAADGHWDFGAGELVYQVPYAYWLKDLFGTKLYVNRRRPGEGKLLTRDANGKRRPCELYVSADYAGRRPGLWDGTGTWQKVTTVGYELLPDRLGIRLTRPDPENYVISQPQPSGSPFPSGAVRVVSCLANPGAGGETTTKRFCFRLVTVIEGDAGLKAEANRRVVSPTRFTVRRRSDNRGWFRKEVVAPSSPYYTGNNQDEQTVTDDTKEAVAHAQAKRRATEVGPVAGSFTVRRVTFAYQVGQVVRKVGGREVSLRQNLGAAEGESPVLPAVVAVRWDFDEKRETVVSFSDRRADPPPERRR